MLNAPGTVHPQVRVRPVVPWSGHQSTHSRIWKPVFAQLLARTCALLIPLSSGEVQATKHRAHTLAQRTLGVLPTSVTKPVDTNRSSMVLQLSLPLNPEYVLKADTHTLDELAKQDLNDRLRAKALSRIPPLFKLFRLVHLEHARQNTPRYKASGSTQTSTRQPIMIHVECQVISLAHSHLDHLVKAQHFTAHWMRDPDHVRSGSRPVPQVIVMG